MRPPRFSSFRTAKMPRPAMQVLGSVCANLLKLYWFQIRSKLDRLLTWLLPAFTLSRSERGALPLVSEYSEPHLPAVFELRQMEPRHEKLICVICLNRSQIYSTNFIPNFDTASNRKSNNIVKHMRLPKLTWLLKTALYSSDFHALDNQSRK